MILWIPRGHGPYNTARPRPLNFCRFAKLQNAKCKRHEWFTGVCFQGNCEEISGQVACNTKNHLGHFPPNNLVWLCTLKNWWSEKLNSLVARREELLCMEKITGHSDVGSFRHNQSTSSLETEKFVLLWSTFIFN